MWISCRLPDTKFYAPKGIGGQYIHPRCTINNLLHGGHQEGGRRAGTENVLGVVALGEACQIIHDNLEHEQVEVAALRDKLESGLMGAIPYLSRNGDPERRVCNTTNLVFEYIEGEALLLSLDMAGVAISSGSACSTGSDAPSHVLTAMGLPPEKARASLRFSIGRFTSENEVDHVLSILPPIVERLRSMSPIYPGK